MLKKFFPSLLLWSLMNLIPTVAHACAVCFGGASSNLTRGFFWGIVVLLSLPFLLIGIIATLVVRSSKQHKNHVSLT